MTGSAITVTNVQFIGNRAFDGGGVWTRNSSANRLVNVLLARNTVTNTGAAIYVYRGTVDIIHATVGAPSFVNAAAIFITGTSSSRVNITNTIVTGHAIGIQRAGASAVAEDYNRFFGVTASLDGTMISGGHSGVGDPRFVAAPSDDYHLGSSALKAGVDLAVAFDLDGRSRGLPPDIGAYEWRAITYDQFVYLPMVRK
jgi:hypothetical protein